MNGETCLMAKLAAAARTAIRGDSFSCELPAYVEELSFRFLPKRRLFRRMERTAASPAEWFALCRGDGLRDVLLLIRTRKDRRELLGFANTTPVSIAALYRDGSVRYWTGRWDFDAESGKWRVVYSEHPWQNAPKGSPSFEDNTEAFRGSLVEIERLADELGAGDFAQVFREARAILDGAAAERCPDGALRALPAKNLALYLAASKADVFGAMGSWNDTPAYLAGEKGREEEYGRVSDELLRQCRLAVMYALNQWD